MVHISSLQFLHEEMSRLRAKFYVTIILKIYIQTNSVADFPANFLLNGGIGYNDGNIGKCSSNTNDNCIMTILSFGAIYRWFSVCINLKNNKFVIKKPTFIRIEKV